MESGGSEESTDHVHVLFRSLLEKTVWLQSKAMKVL